MQEDNTQIEISDMAQITELSGVRILLVDDDNDNLDLLSFLFENSGAEVETASSAEEALKKFTAYKPNIVISDIGMPDEDGYALIQKIRAIADSEQVPAIALTAFTKNEDRLLALQKGFQLHVKKPVDPTELTRQVTKLLSNSKTQAPLFIANKF